VQMRVDGSPQMLQMNVKVSVTSFSLLV
jgi:hypothetical protein